MYIYKTTNLINGKIYIGKSELSIFRKNYLGSGIILKRAIKKYSKKCFKKTILFKCSNKKELCEKEIYYIALYNSRDHNIGYNISEGGDGGSFKGRKHSEETKIKMRNSSKHLSGKDHPNFNKKASASTRRKLRRVRRLRPLIGLLNGMFGKKLSEENKLKMNAVPKIGKLNSMYGKKHSKKTISRMSIAMNGKKNPFFGKTHSDETRIKMSQSMIGRIPWNKGLTKENNDSLKCASEKLKIKLINN
jgi:group I intron endonuclease